MRKGQGAIHESYIHIYTVCCANEAGAPPWAEILVL